MNQSRPQNSLALVSLIAGIASWTVAPVIASVVAIVCGHMARNQIRQTGEDGDQLAVIGLALGYVHVALVCVGTCALVAIYAGVIAMVLGNAPH